MKTSPGLLFVAVLVCSILSAQALTPSQRSAIRTALESAKTVELPQMAETLMREAKDSDRAETAKIILEYTLAKQPAARRPVYAMMSKLYPETFIAVSRASVGAVAVSAPRNGSIDPNVPLTRPIPARVVPVGQLGVPCRRTCPFHQFRQVQPVAPI